MQDRIERRSNAARRQATRTALIAAARKLFVEKGYADSGTPEIVAMAKVTRGALYHHFTDKADLFRAVVEEEARAVAARIEADSQGGGGALEALMAGAQAYFSAMAEPGRTRLLLLDGPSVLGHVEMNRIDRETGGEELRQGLAAALPEELPLEALSDVLSAGFDRAALAIAEGEDAEAYRAATRLLLASLIDKA